MFSVRRTVCAVNPRTAADTAPGVRGARAGLIAFICVVLAVGAAFLLWAVSAAASNARQAVVLLIFASVMVGMGVFLCVALAKDPSRRSPGVSRSGRVATTHTLAFTVGDRETHNVVYTFDQMWGWLTISVDGKLIVKKFITNSFQLKRVFEFEVGQHERHIVRIEKTRPLFFAGLNPQPIRAFCDGVQVAENSGVS